MLNLPFLPKRKFTHLEIGKLGEKIAKHFLISSGAKILRKNFRSPRGGEIDLIIREKEVLVFVEVKTRTNQNYGRPIESVDKKKQLYIQRAANYWLSLLKNRDIYFRYDVIEIFLEKGEKPKIQRVLDAF